ncbi:hypothetical protein DVH24_028711 [Malus domestica]|uniref:KIB1-4 beta-propeller domain-containing protein n=1 Tax=Malus domestica TaxID=3750 RepID=A0A498J107_MALDO|nr:hypothetical protein DVH24_028711 [Malus domestica]
MQSDWANLPTNILLSTVSDCVQFMAVCKSWRCMKKDRKCKHARLTTPMILVSERKENTWNSYDFVNNQVLGLQLELPKKRFCGSSKGWIITVEANFVVTLMNPQFNVKRWTKRPIIRIPQLKPVINRRIRGFVKAHFDYFVVKATISADSISNSKNYVVMVILGKDTRWNYIDKHGDDIYTFITDVVLIEDKIYAINDWSNLWAF